MHNRRLLLIVVIVAGIVGLGACDSLPESAKPDIHLTFEIHADGSNTAAVEVAVHPLLDPLLRPVLSQARQLLEGNTDQGVSLMQTERAGREYSRLMVEFDSMADLTSFMNTPQLMSSIASEVAPDLTIPSLFSEFDAWYDPQKQPVEYGIQARIAPEETTYLSVIKLTTHVIMPYSPQENNAFAVSARTLTWNMIPGQPLEMVAIARQTPADRAVSWLRPVLIGVTIVVLVGVAVLLTVLLRRRRQTLYQDSLSGGFDDW